MNSLHQEYIKRLVEVNDETKTQKEHNLIELCYRSWREGVIAAGGHFFNGDYYYIEKFDSGELAERPLCCGIFLDWVSKST